MHSTKVRAYAKVNLTLEIVGRAGGFHELDSLVASVDVSDTVILKKRKGKLYEHRHTENNDGNYAEFGACGVEKLVDGFHKKIKADVKDKEGYDHRRNVFDSRVTVGVLSVGRF